MVNSVLYGQGLPAAAGVSARGGGYGGGDGAAGIRGLTPAQRRQVEELRRSDQETRAHETAHIRAGNGVVTSSASYVYSYGPDGKAYAVGGEVGIDVSPANRPEDNVEKGRAIREAALAPAQPSPQDFRVAAVGAQLEAQGQSALLEQSAIATTTAETQSAVQTETRRQGDDQRRQAAVKQSRQLGEQQNQEPRIDVGERLAELTRQRLIDAYLPSPGGATTGLSLFA